MSHVNVYLRQRPVAKDTVHQQLTTEVSANGVTVIAGKTEQQPEREITIDGHYGPETPQDELFQQVGKQSCDKALSGFNSTVICFGPTGSGKTYTIFGEKGKEGLVPRMLQYIFQQKENRGQFEYQFHASFVELYLDQPYDLLVSAPASRPSSANNDNTEQRKVLTLRQSISGSFYAEGVKVKQFKSYEEGMQLLETGTSQRQTFQTKLNERSSRSHAIFSVGIIQKNRVTGVATGSLLTFVDLAGSENLSKSQSDGQRLVETQSINRSLSTLGFVIQALALNKSHIPYRESKLTKLLTEALGGSSYTAMVCCVYPLLENAHETAQSLIFATKCRNVINQPKIGVVDISGIETAARIKQLIQEIEILKLEKQKVMEERDVYKLQISELERTNSPTLSQSNTRQYDYENEQKQFYRKQDNAQKKEPLQANIEFKQIQQKQQDFNQPFSFKGNNQNQQKQIQQNSENCINYTKNQVKTTAESVHQMRSKLELKNKEMIEIQFEAKKKAETDRITIQNLKKKICDLEDQIYQTNDQANQRIEDQKKQTQQQIQGILDAQTSVFKNQEKLMSTFSNKELVNKLGQLSAPVNHYVEVEKMKVELIEKMDFQKETEMQRLKTIHDKETTDLKNTYEQQIEQQKKQIAQYQKYQEQLQKSILWFNREYAKSQILLYEAKEGKLDSYILNEQELIQKYLQFATDQKPIKTKVKAAIQIDPEREPFIVPRNIAEMVNEIQTIEAQTLEKESTLSLSREPSFRKKEIPEDFMQPLMKKTYSNFKPPNVTLNMDIHISPRPKTASTKQPIKQFESTRPKSALPLNSSQIGSCGGTTSLSNKQYQKWGW
ncbi:Kinesin_like protein [Hexamita inflata]|uniref:Kinesin like protein n=1 Tax=Hexamita inflata TaxID=28002 RepID=A0AA86Q517_9EUKA|nr:Kinesin like protein [Hexamita inflata]